MLQWIRVPVITNNKCAQSYQSFKVTESMICAGYKQGGKDACQGDSGGPFICEGQNKEAILTGIVSWGIGCARANNYGVYARVTKILDWIKSNMKSTKTMTTAKATVTTTQSTLITNPSPMTATSSLPPSAPKCALVPQFMINNRIVGGQPAESMIPWQVSIRTNGFHFCGGTILDSKTILSAAHCFQKGTSTRVYTIKAGSTKNAKSGESSEQIKEFEKIIWNEDLEYDSAGTKNDWVIVKLSSPLSFDSNIQPACLPPNDWMPDENEYKNCYVSGWGATGEGSVPLPSILQWVKVPAITNGKCSESYNDAITDSMICAGYPQGEKDACQGDSGGPFVCKGPSDEAFLTGIVSWGYGCARAGYYGVYSRVTKILNWIQNNMVINLSINFGCRIIFSH